MCSVCAIVNFLVVLTSRRHQCLVLNEREEQRTPQAPNGGNPALAIMNVNLSI